MFIWGGGGESFYMFAKHAGGEALAQNRQGRNGGATVSIGWPGTSKPNGSTHERAANELLNEAQLP